MYTGTLEFSASNGSVVFEDYEIDSCPVSGLDRVVLRANEKNFIAKCFISIESLDGIENFVGVVKDFCEDRIDELCLFLDDQVGNLKLSDHSFVDSAGNVSAVSLRKTVSVTVSWKIFGKMDVSFDNVTSYLGIRSGEQQLLCRLFRTAIKISDNVHAYMLLYHILLIKCGDAQARVDDLIKLLRPNVECSVYDLRGRPRQETLFTKLRNEIGHRRSGRSYDVTRREIDAVINEFRLVVRDAIVSTGHWDDDPE